MLVVIVRPLRDGGWAVLFLAADTETGSEVNVALDHGSAQDVLDALVAGEDASAEVEAWQVWGGLGA
jgi:hypothetical protein